MQNAFPTGSWPNHGSTPPWLASNTMRMLNEEDSDSETDAEGEDPGGIGPESRKVPVSESDAEVYEITVDGTVEISGAVTITIRKVQ